MSGSNDPHRKQQWCHLVIAWLPPTETAIRPHLTDLILCFMDDLNIWKRMYFCSCHHIPHHTASKTNQRKEVSSVAWYWAWNKGWRYWRADHECFLEESFGALVHLLWVGSKSAHWWLIWWIQPSLLSSVWSLSGCERGRRMVQGLRTTVRELCCNSGIEPMNLQST